MINSLSARQKEAILAAIFGRRKIEAIKLVRDATGGGLKEAKEFVEKYSAELEAKTPDKFSRSKAKGCRSVLALALALGALGYGATKVLQNV